MVDTLKLKIMVVMEGWEAEPGRCLEHDEGHAGGDQEGPGEGEAIFGTCPVSRIIIFCPKKIDQVSIITIIVITTLRRQRQCQVRRYKPQALTNRGGFPPGSTDLSIGCFFFSRRYAKCRDFVNLYLFCICEDWFGKEVFIMWHLIERKIRIHQRHRQLPSTKYFRCSLKIVHSLVFNL